MLQLLYESNKKKNTINVRVYIYDIFIHLVNINVSVGVFE